MIKDGVLKNPSPCKYSGSACDAIDPSGENWI
jgi:hypothetical protein